ncbi:MAG: UbiH/UbiF family hydroxylase [Pseudomonadota bacterium]
MKRAIWGRMSEIKHTDILVAGAGPTAFAAALEASAAGFKIAMAAPDDTHLESDARTTALMMPAIDLLKNMGVWDGIESNTAPLRVLRIIDDTGRLLRAPSVDFKSSETGYDQFGFNIPNRVLNGAMRTAVENDENITVHNAMVSAVAFDTNHVSATLSNGTIIDANLIVGADGANSLVRNAADIGVRKWDYPQTALVTAFDHERPHQGVSAEFHTPQGPFTQVPLPGNRSSLVWVVEPERVSELTAMDKAELSLLIEKNLQHTLGKIKNPATLQAWPLSASVAHRFGHERVMLVGHAAHSFPPIGAQGLNLGFRDIDDLGAVLSDAKAAGYELGSSKVTRAYDRRRRADIYVRTGAVDALNRSLLTDLLPVQALRATGLSALKNISFLRSFFMREGISPGGGLRGLFD